MNLNSVEIQVLRCFARAWVESVDKKLCVGLNYQDALGLLDRICMSVDDKVPGVRS